MGTPEGDVKKKIKALFEKHKAYYYMFVPTGYGKRGVPDFLVCVHGRFLAVEAKAGKGKPTGHQKKELQAVLNAGGTAFVINEDNLDALEKWLESV